MIITNIGCLVGIDSEKTLYRRGKEMKTLNTLADAWLRIEGERFHSWGKMSDLPAEIADEVIDAEWGYVIPSFCDSHTHIVYAGNRDGEFIDKINGLSYEEIARRGGGILNSSKLLNKTSENDLFHQSLQRAEEMMRKGTGCVEIKSGYGLTLDSELKMLRVIARIAETVPMKVKATFLGAHAVGPEFTDRQGEYVDYICREMLPAVSAEGLAEFVDVFCDAGFFTMEETDKILETGARYGLRPKIHANELAESGGVEIGVKHGALSVDHLERAGAAQIRMLAESQTVGTMLPGASFFLGMPYAPARKAVDSGAIVALASDYNPGSSPSGDMRFVAALGCIKMKLTPEEALNAVTLNGAFAMGEAENYGSIAPGKMANFIVTHRLSSIAYPMYAYNTPFISRLFLRGKAV